MADSHVGDEKSPGVKFSKGYRYYALGLLLLVYIFNFLDRQILSILMPLIKADLGLSDTQLGLLSGLAFALFYSTLGIPIARWADRGSRRSIIALALAIWSAMTALSGLAGNFWQMAIARVGVGVGEAGCSPPSHSLISDFFPLEKRGTAMSIYSMGIPIGVLLGFLFGGQLGETFGWRWTFVIVGAPGILLALVVRYTLREPTRGMSEKVAVKDEEFSIGQVFHVLWEKKTFRHLSFAAALHAFTGYGVGTWVPSFLYRVHEMSLSNIGLVLAMVAGIAGGIGTFMGGWLTDKMQTRDQRWIVWVPGLATAAAVPFAFGVYLLDDISYVVASMILPNILGYMYLGPTFALTQSLVSVKMRALAAAILLLIINLIGLGLGPSFIGMLSDWFTGMWGPDGLRYALLSGVVINLWCAAHYMFAARYIREDIAAVHANS